MITDLGCTLISPTSTSKGLLGGVGKCIKPLLSLSFLLTPSSANNRFRVNTLEISQPCYPDPNFFIIHKALATPTAMAALDPVVLFSNDVRTWDVETVCTWVQGLEKLSHLSNEFRSMFGGLRRRVASMSDNISPISPQNLRGSFASN